MFRGLVVTMKRSDLFQRLRQRLKLPQFGTPPVASVEANRDEAVFHWTRTHTRTRQIGLRALSHQVISRVAVAAAIATTFGGCRFARRILVDVR